MCVVVCGLYCTHSRNTHAHTHTRHCAIIFAHWPKGNCATGAAERAPNYSQPSDRGFFLDCSCCCCCCCKRILLSVPPVCIFLWAWFGLFLLLGPRQGSAKNSTQYITLYNIRRGYTHVHHTCTYTHARARIELASHHIGRPAYTVKPRYGGMSRDRRNVSP